MSTVPTYITITINGFTSSPSPIWDPAEICFEPYPDNPIRVTEMQKSVCVSVVRDVGDPDVFQYRAVSIANLDADRAALGMCIYIQQLAGNYLIHSSDWYGSNMETTVLLVLFHIVHDVPNIGPGACGCAMY